MPGSCRGAFNRWTFEDGVCEAFVYGGCGGNKNNFRSKQVCLKVCKGEKVPVKKLKSPKGRSTRPSQVSNEKREKLNNLQRQKKIHQVKKELLKKLPTLLAEEYLDYFDDIEEEITD